MRRCLVLAVSFAVTVPGLGFAKRLDPIHANCGSEPVNDPGAKADVARAERALAKIKANQSKVFAAYRSEYDKNRKQIIARNKRLPKEQHLPVPAKKNDDELRASAEYRNRVRDVGADPGSETAAQRKIEAERTVLAGKQTAYTTCKDGILKRMRTAGSKRAEELLKIAKDKRLREEIKRLAELKRIHASRLDQTRKSKAMAPILSAGVCARKNMQRDLDREIRGLKRSARREGVDKSTEITALRERRRSLELDVIELRRDFKNLRLRRVRCGRRNIRDLTACVRAAVTTPGSMPAVCKGQFEDQLELLGLWSRSFE